MTASFQSVLVANRGEIACRVMRTARAMGLRTVAVHSDADRNALHVREADTAIALGGTTAAESYLRIDALVDAARQSGAQAVHPGYGFLSENPRFVDACEAAGLVFIGPSASAMRAMGLKDAAKRLMAEAGVPVVPGYHGDAQDDERLLREADAVGYPVLIKARAGGGGKGMRVVDKPADFSEALASARREARASFGDDAVLIEKLIDSPRHIEVQIVGDTHGSVVHLFERDCSLQRRHQKVIEEAPAPGISESVRQAMTAAAIRAAKAIDYVGAGTIEFIADGRDGLRDDGFWFMEMNTRLQVEHPVSEAITGIDLVEWQMRVAAGEPLPLAQDEIRLMGHAVEARLYAEDVPAGFLPATGRLDTLAFGADGRVDTGVEPGDEVTPFYDPMLAKLVAHAPSRRQAFGRLERQLARTVVMGSVTNRDFLLRLCTHADVLDGVFDTGLIARDIAALTAAARPDELRTARAVAAVLRVTAHQHRPVAGVERPLAADLGCWQLWGRPTRTVRFSCGSADAGEVMTLSLALNENGEWAVSDGTATVHVALAPDQAHVSTDGRRQRVQTRAGEGEMWLNLGEQIHRFSWPIAAGDSRAGQSDGDVVAPMPGRIIAVECVEGQQVREGQALLTLEAMKMEHTLRAPREGIVARLHARAGAQAAMGETLLSLAE